MYNDSIMKIWENIYTNVTREEMAKLQELSRDRKICVEIGSYLGASSCAIASGFNNDSQRLYCIDIWRSQPELRPDPKDGRKIYDVFIDNINTYTNGRQGQVRPLKRTSEKAIEYFQFEDIKIDFLFIDGDHSYEAVKRDFNLYFEYIRPGGIIVLHDYGWSSVRQVIEEKIRPVTRRHDNLSNLWWAKK